MFTHGNLWSAIQAVTTYLGIGPDDRIASLLPFSSVYGLNQLLCAVRTGAALVVQRSPVPHQIVTEMRVHAVTVLAAVPPLWLQLLSVPSFCSEAIPSLRVLQNAGGHLPTEAVRRIRRAQPHARLFLQYGMTETFRSTFLSPEEVDRRPDSMGQAIPGAEILVLREDCTPCEPGEVGELVHRGPTVAAGYWNDPESTARVFRVIPRSVERDSGDERVVFSGDLVRRDAEGFLYYVSRRDRIIKSLGFRIGPDEIVEALYASGEISEAAVTAEADEQRGARIVAFVVLAPGGCAKRLEAFCRAELPRHMQPARIDVCAAIPRLASGKYDIAALSEAHATA
jgi:acyl-CoA synthetase (AMP-forming)/AMP-acid ligase II